jgi:2',3'-cyclic-nucleotide 2'-phosphodiesterase/3'-nucleotidase
VFATPGRVRDLCFADGSRVAPDQRLLIITNSYRAGGGGHFDMAAQADTVLQDPTALREIVSRHINHQSPLTVQAEPVWRFHPIGATVLADTGPAALAKTGVVTACGLKYRGETPDGFARFAKRI